jgi:glutathione S-transferase
MAIKLHRCAGTIIKGPHPCWKVQKALDDAGIEYERVLHPIFPRGRRKDLIAQTGDSQLPAIELEDGTVKRESKDLIAAISEGQIK